MNTNQILSDHFDDPYHRGHCDSPTHVADVNAGTCQIQLELSLHEQRVVEAWFDGAGCEVCEGLASILVECSEGRAISEIEQLYRNQLEKYRLFGDHQLDKDCSQLPIAAFHAALANPLNCTDDDLADGSNFGGPSLSEEC